MIRGAKARARCCASFDLGVFATGFGSSTTDVDDVVVVACWEALGSEFGSGESFRIFLGRKGIFEGGDEIGVGTLMISVGAEAKTAEATVVTAEVEVSIGFWVWV